MSPSTTLSRLFFPFYTLIHLNFYTMLILI